MENLDIEKFDPTAAELRQLVSITQGVTATDLKDKAQMEVVRKNRIALRDARVTITRRGKELREDALAFQKAVITKEKELIAIIEPEEERLKAIEDEAKRLKERAERMALLPERKKKLSEINDGLDFPDDDTLIAMDGAAFQGYCNERVAAKNEKARLELEARENEIKT